MDSFEFFIPVKFIFGPGQFDRLGECAQSAETRALLVTGRSSARRLGYLQRAVGLLEDAGVDVGIYDEVPPNPTDEVVDAGAEIAKQHGSHFVVGLGGGSAMDTAKAIAVAATHPFPISEFLVADENGQTRQPTDDTLPIVCVTTTSGTSSELTPFAVITTIAADQKSAIGDAHCFPRTSICDPELTYSMPPEITAACGIDVLCHAVETYICTVASPLTDYAAEQAIRLVGEYLARAFADGADKEARNHMSLANAFAGISLGNCGATVMHALEHPVSAYLPEVAHGAGLAALLVPYARSFWEVEPEKFARVSALLGGPEDPEGAAECFENLLDQVQLNVGLSELGVRDDMLDTIAEDALRYMDGAVEKTPGSPAREQLVQLLRGSM